jgi:hypothetical protein
MMALRDIDELDQQIGILTHVYRAHTSGDFELAAVALRSRNIQGTAESLLAPGGALDEFGQWFQAGDEGRESLAICTAVTRAEQVFRRRIHPPDAPVRIHRDNTRG